MSDSHLFFLNGALANPDRIAVVIGESRSRFRDLLAVSERVAHYLLRGRTDLEGARIVLLVPPGFAHVVAQWGIWRAGGVVVPLALAHPVLELVSLIRDADPELVLVHPGTERRGIPAAEACGVPWIDVVRTLGGPPGTILPDLLAPMPNAPPLPDVSENRAAQIIYTSGTTGRAKGVVMTHAAARHQVESIARAWEITVRDRVLNALPLHHVHGAINALLCPLWCGGSVEFLPRFDADEVWRCIARLRVSVFMGVPTMYVRLIRAWEEASPREQTIFSKRAYWLRLTISGSAALPRYVHGRWAEITEQTILERYGLTETGMVLTQSLNGYRAEGFVGDPFPSVQVRLRGDDGGEALPGEEGSIEVRGPGVFSEYWRRPEETAAAFREDGWFRTGDRAVRHERDGYRILGRESIDIIKTGGEKVSALEIEEVLRRHPGIADCAVVGIPDDEWGEQVCAAVVFAPHDVVTSLEMRIWVKDHLAGYKAPARFMAIEALPGNSMGKVLKSQVRDLFLRLP
jgi:malonyl-CoA/methylmalonyl-CoA synthetase